MKALSTLFFIITTSIAFSGCDKQFETFLTNPAVQEPAGQSNQGSGNLVLGEDISASVGAISGNSSGSIKASLEQNIKNKGTLKWFSNWGLDENDLKEVLVRWKDGDGPLNEKWVKPVYWDGVNPIDTKNHVVYLIRSTAEEIAMMCSSTPYGKELVESWYRYMDGTVDWDKAIQELEVNLPEAIKWVKREWTKEEMKQIWGPDYNWEWIFRVLDGEIILP